MILLAPARRRKHGVVVRGRSDFVFLTFVRSQLRLFLPELLSDPDPEKAQRVTQVMFTMKNLDIRALKQAYEQ